MTDITYIMLGFTDEAEKKDYIHRLGNLTLLYNTDNASVGNKKYIDKQSTYKESDFRMTKTLVEPLQTSVKNGMDTKLFACINAYEKQYSDIEGLWTKSLIEQRSNDMVQLMEKIVLNNYSI